MQQCISLNNDHITMIGINMSEPHTCELNAGVDIFLVRHVVLYVFDAVI